jgi:CRP-like cAMP-binding protein
MVKHERETVAAIKRAALFRALAPATQARLAASVTTLNLPRGRQLYRNGERCPGLYIVVSGRIMLSVGATDGDSKVIELIGPGGHVGLAATVLGTPQAATAETLADSTLLLIPREALLDSAAHIAELGLQLMAALGRGVCGLITDIEAFSLRSGRERVANYLLQLATANGTRTRPFTLPAKKSLIASRLNLTPEYFSRMLHELIATGTITVNGRQITILDPDRLHGTSR